MRFRVFHLYAESSRVFITVVVVVGISLKISYNCFMVLKSDSHTHRYSSLPPFFCFRIGTMGPAAAREDPQETWLSESQISWCGEFARRWSVKRLAEHRLAVTNPISQHRFASHLSGSAVQRAVVHGELGCCFIIRFHYLFNLISLFEQKAGGERDRECVELWISFFASPL